MQCSDNEGHVVDLLSRDPIASMFGGALRPLVCRHAGHSIAVVVLTFAQPAGRPPDAGNPDTLFPSVWPFYLDKILTVFKISLS
jgi:hypothetical protein